MGGVVHRFGQKSVVRVTSPLLTHRLRVFVADVLDQLVVGLQHLRLDLANRFRVGLRIVNRDLNVHVPEIAAAETLRQLHDITMRVAEPVQPGFVVETDRFDDQRVAIPLVQQVFGPDDAFDTAMRVTRIGGGLPDARKIRTARVPVCARSQDL